MSVRFYRQKGFILTLFLSLLIISITILTDLKKDHFVTETGNFKIFGGLSIIMAFGLITRWKLVYYITAVLIFLVFIAMVFFTFHVEQEFLLAFIVLLIVLLGVFILLLSKPVKDYTHSR